MKLENSALQPTTTSTPLKISSLIPLSNQYLDHQQSNYLQKGVNNSNNSKNYYQRCSKLVSYFSQKSVELTPSDEHLMVEQANKDNLKGTR